MYKIKRKNDMFLALVFMIRRLLRSWKVTFAYYFSPCPVTSFHLQELVVSVVKKLKTISFHPKILICDQVTTNRIALVLLGVSKDQPYINVDNIKMLYCFDIIYLLKSARNNFINKILQFKLNNV